MSTLEINDETTERSKKSGRAFPGNIQDAQAFILELQEERKIANCSRCEGEPFCPLFVACAYSALGRTDSG